MLPCYHASCGVHPRSHLLRRILLDSQPCRPSRRPRQLRILLLLLLLLLSACRDTQAVRPTMWCGAKRTASSRRIANPRALLYGALRCAACSAMVYCKQSGVPHTHRSPGRRPYPHRCPPLPATVHGTTSRPEQEGAHLVPLGDGVGGLDGRVHNHLRVPAGCAPQAHVGTGPPALDALDRAAPCAMQCALQ
jgi:hypothetical protein